MDQARARELLDEERRRLDVLAERVRSEREGATAAMSGEADWWDDSAELTGELLDAGALDELLSRRRAGLAEAERRLAEGSYGRSVQSGELIPDERLEADPLATLTADEAERSTRRDLGGRPQEQVHRHS